MTQEPPPPPYPSPPYPPPSYPPPSYPSPSYPSPSYPSPPYPPPPYPPPDAFGPPGQGQTPTDPGLGGIFPYGAPPPAGGPSSGNGDVLRRVGLAVAAVVALVLVGVGTVLCVSYLGSDQHGNAAASVAPAPATSTPAPGSGVFPPTTTTSNTSTTPTTTSPARSPGQLAASAINGDIAQSIAARKLIGPANAHTRACLATPADVDALDSAASTRTDLIAQLGRLDVRDVSGGAAVVADLTEAWTYSAQADRAYADWARNHLSCTGHAATNGDTDWERAHSNDLMSTAAKRRAVTDWNPIAARYHLPARSADTI